MKENTKKETLELEKGILPISTIATVLGVHQRTLRIYDNEGILSPKRSDKNRRNYSFNDLEKAKTIAFLTKNLAVNLAGIKIIFSILNYMQIKPDEYCNFIEKIAKKAGINTEIQEKNKTKNSNRGRKPKSNS